MPTQIASRKASDLDHAAYPDSSNGLIDGTSLGSRWALDTDGGALTCDSAVRRLGGARDLDPRGVESLEPREASPYFSTPSTCHTSILERRRVGCGTSASDIGG